MEKPFHWKEILDLQSVEYEFKSCQRSDGSLYGTAPNNKCRIGTEVSSSASDPDPRVSGHPVLARLSTDDRAAVTEAMVNFQQRLSDEGYQSDAIADWTDAQLQMLDTYEGAGEARGGKYTSEEIKDGCTNMYARAEKEMVGKMPEYLDNGEGIYNPASLGMKPRMSATQLKWEDPIIGSQYSPAKTTKEKEIKRAEKSLKKAEKDGDEYATETYKSRIQTLKKLPDGTTIGVRNGVSSSNFNTWQNGNDRKMLEFKAEREKAGLPWPVPNPRTPSQKEIDNLTKKRPDLWMSGFNTQNLARNRKDSIEVYGLGKDVKITPEIQAARDRKTRAVAEVYLQQGGRSPVTGERIKLPRSKDVGTKTVVDHVEAYANVRDRNPKLSTKDLDKKVNTVSNFMVVEADLNNSKKDAKDWSAASKTIQGKMSTSKIQRDVTNSWAERGSKVTLSRGEYNRRVGGGFDSTSTRQAVASKHEQDRLSKIFKTPPESIKPTRRTSKGPDPLRNFTSPNESAYKKEKEDLRGRIAAARQEGRSSDVEALKQTLSNL